jgi:hypothetical protein
MTHKTTIILAAIVLVCLSDLLLPFPRESTQRQVETNRPDEASVVHQAFQKSLAEAARPPAHETALSPTTKERPEPSKQNPIRPPSPSTQDKVSAHAKNDPFAGVSELVQAWLRLPLTPETFADGIAFLRDRYLPGQARLIVMDKLHSWRRRLAPDDLILLFSETYPIAGDATLSAALRSRAVSAMASLLVVMQEQKALARADVEAYFPFLTQLSQNQEAAPEVRGRAIRALGILKAESAGTVLRTLLAAPENINEPDLARNSCLALAQIYGPSAVGPISEVLMTTTDKTIFGTAAFALGQIHTPASLVALIQNQDRFPDSGSPDAALVNMEDVILDMLQHPTNPNVGFAIEATRHLWKDGQRERYTPILRTLIADAPLPHRKAAVERLIEDARSLPLQNEQRELSAVLPTISSHPELAGYSRQIQNRLKARPGPVIPAPFLTLAAGNTSGQEYGDAVYKKLSVISWFGYNYNHAGLFAGQSGGTKRCIEAVGLSLDLDTTSDNPFASSFTDYGSDYYGAFQLSNETLTFSQRKAIMATAQQVADAYIYYTYFSALDPLTSARPITIANIDNLRCDGVVEYCYEVNGHQSWWHTSYPSRWNISWYPDEHNDAPDLTVNPDTEESPWSQRGAPASSSEGPGYSGTNPNNAYLRKSAVITYPTYQTSYVRINNTTINVTITAKDESGIAYIGCMLPGSSSWLYTPWGTQHPTDDSCSEVVTITSSGALNYFAEDNGGNYPPNAVGLGVYGISSTAGSGGSISPSGTFIVLSGDSSTYNASPNANYLVNQWLLDGNVVQTGGSSYTLSNIQANRSVQVTFTYSPSGTSAITLALPQGGACSAQTLGPTNDLKAGYAKVAISSGSTPYGIAVFAYSQNGYVVTEAGVPASPPTRFARFFVDYRANLSTGSGSINVSTGFAAVNLGTGPASVTLRLVGENGNTLAQGTMLLMQNEHIAKYLNQLEPGFVLPPGFISNGLGTLEIISDQPISVLALRLTINQRGELLLTTTPTADLGAAPPNGAAFFPQIAEGGGYQTTIILINTSNLYETGVVRFYDNSGNGLVIDLANSSTSSSQFPYSIPPGGLARLVTSGAPQDVKVGWAQLVPDSGSTLPMGAGIFGLTQRGVLVTESGVPATVPTTHARIYVDQSGGHDTGLAIVNPERSPIRIIATAFLSDGITPAGIGQGSIDLPASGHAAAFVWQMIAGLPDGYKGVLDISSTNPFGALTLRSLTNGRGDFLLTSFPIADANQSPAAPIIFPQIADGGGYQTEIILLSTSWAPSSATVTFLGNDGMPIRIGKIEDGGSATNFRHISMPADPPIDVGATTPLYREPEYPQKR